MNSFKVPRIRFKEFDVIWVEKRIADIVKISAGGDVDKIKLKESGKYPVVANALTNKGIVGFYDDYKVKAPAVTVTGRGDVGYAVARHENFTPIVRLLTLQSENIDVDYLENQINSMRILNESTGVPQLTAPQLGNYKVYHPEIDEQSAIGSLFRTLDDLLASYKNNLANYQSLKTTMLSKMFPKAGQTVPEIRLDGFDGEWECVKMEDIFQIIDGDRGKSYPGESDFSSFGHTLFLDTGNVKKTGLDFSTTKFISEEKDKELRNGKLILGDFILTSRGTLGNVAYYDENIKKRYSSVRINSAMLILRPLLGDKISHEYILAILRGNLISDFMKVNQVGSAQPHITKKEFSKIKVQVPSNIREQQAIGTYFTNLDNLISAHQEKITQLETLKKKLLQDMFI
ncbi:Type Ic restriction-modification system [Streptococcus thermophilus]|nr:restriction endonuclease subunit S [Streptococcus thermophilus]MCZ0707782.1 restriction endonuclease subunit S [Streptococcus thermophilus]MDA5404945.1 restriction endonuclease subunit S [Streptococcus thermophilus]MDA5412444.1 restriction endonuclease subunit S [Streptococcus thermophilus]MDA5453668.1 restriction endonuclease subunit S [Streptococcus thermophilus]SSC62808.1 Type Ic restriction-modification system [Streptococcus thermophilus]